MNPHHESGTYACWRCLERDVESAGDECSVCRKKPYDHLRRMGQRKTQTHESTHRKHRAPLEELDRIPTGKKPDYQPGFQDELDAGRESWDRYLMPPPAPSSEASTDGVVIKTGEDAFLEALADEWLRKTKAELRAAKRKDR